MIADPNQQSVQLSSDVSSSSTARYCTLIRASSEGGVHRHHVVPVASSAVPDGGSDSRGDTSDRRQAYRQTGHRSASSANEKSHLLAYRTAAVQYLNRTTAGGYGSSGASLVAASSGSGSGIHHYILPCTGGGFGGGGGGGSVVGSNTVFPTASTLSLSMLGYTCPSPCSPPPSPPRLAVVVPTRKLPPSLSLGQSTGSKQERYGQQPHLRQRPMLTHGQSMLSAPIATGNNGSGVQFQLSLPTQRRLSASETRLPAIASSSVDIAAGASTAAAAKTRSMSAHLNGSIAGSCGGGLLDFGRISTSSIATLERERRRLRINVSGQYFETLLTVLERHPSTLLGDRRKRSQFFDRRRQELFFDRHRPSFEAIFLYYQSGGRLRRPAHIPDDVFLDELLFYQLEPDVVDEYRRSEGYTPEVAEFPENKTLKWLWMLFEYPETSRAAYVIAIFSVIVTLISIVLFCVETLPEFAMTHCVADEAPNFLDVFFLIETACTAWFTIEAIVRFIASPSKCGFWRDFKNIVDVTAIIPYYVTLFNVLSTMSCASAKSSASLAFLRVIRLIRIFKLTKHSVGLQVLMLTFRASLEGLGLFLVALCVCLLVYSSAIYYAELGEPKRQINSIPDAFWWAIITMTTVGYGDTVPVGYVGKLVGAACAITGVLTLAIPVPIITGHFNRFYAHKTGRGRHM